MAFKDQYPDFAQIEHLVRRARVERAVAISQALIGAGETAVRGLKRLFAAFDRGLAAWDRGLQAERDRRAVEADAFLKRSVPRY